MIDNINIVSKIERLKKDKNAVILGHYYQDPSIQAISDIIGDSLALAQKTVGIEADIILMCGVQFMGETVKILNPDKKVLVPDLNAGCSLADSCKASELAKLKDKYPDYKVVSYINTSAEVKALTDVVVTSSNAISIIESFPKNEKIIFCPDRNLGTYINNITGRNMLLWDGACHVHEAFSIDILKDLKKIYSDAEIISHPECKKDIADISNFVGSTAAMIKYVGESSCKIFIIVTESGILYELQKKYPNKMFIPAPPLKERGTNNICEYMRLNTLEKVYDILLNESNEIILDRELSIKARKCIDKMLYLTK